jgi:hypothetical protein
VAAGDLFETVQRPGDTSRRLRLALGAGALIVGVAVASVTIGSRRSESRETAISSAIQTATATADRLELVALRHERVSTTLTITGVVRNPATGRKIEGLRVAAALLGRDGSQVSHQDAPLDHRALAPGEESSFSVTLPDTGTVERYRVSFRTNRTAIPHVDRRHELMLATRAS